MRPRTKQRTKQRAHDEAIYRKRVPKFLEGKRCAGFGLIEGCQGRPNTVQHAAGRRGERLLDERFWVALCWDPCHAYVEANPMRAGELGLRAPRVGVA